MKDFTETDFYNQPQFFEANKLFEQEIEKYLSKTKIQYKFSKLSISTITYIINLCDFINIHLIYNRFIIDEDFVYLKYKNEMRGMKKNIKVNKNKNKSDDKRKKNSGFSFSNQMSIGYKCRCNRHEHKNPISIKIFNGGSINITGCKDEGELMDVYSKLYHKLLEINTNYYISSLNKKVKIDYFKNLKHPLNIDYRIEMIFSCIKIETNNLMLDVKKLKKIIESKYEVNEIKTVYDNNKQMPLRCYLKIFELTDENDKKRCPTVSIYHSGSINIISKTSKNLYNSLSFIKNIIEENKNEIFLGDLNI